jgi:hypothetical protein
MTADRLFKEASAKRELETKAYYEKQDALFTRAVQLVQSWKPTDDD